LIVHNTCLTEIEYKVETFCYPDNSEMSSYCYTMCPRCHIQLWENDLIIGYEDGRYGSGSADEGNRESQS